MESLQKTLPFGSAQLGGIFLYVLYKGVPSPPGGRGARIILRAQNNTVTVLSFKVVEKNISKSSGSVQYTYWILSKFNDVKLYLFV